MDRTMGQTTSLHCTSYTN